MANEWKLRLYLKTFFWIFCNIGSFLPFVISYRLTEKKHWILLRHRYEWPFPSLPHYPWNALHGKWKSSQLTATVFLYVEFPVCLDLRNVTFQRNFESFVFHFLPGLHWTGWTIWTDGLIKVQTQLQKHSKITTRKTVKNTYSKNYNYNIYSRKLLTMKVKPRWAKRKRTTSLQTTKTYMHNM